ncbi:uncharacterized mitochondrial protein-like protein [Tanacetum coccineum]
MCTYLKNMDGWKLKILKNKSFADIQDLFNKPMKRVNMFMEIDTELVVESSKKTKAEVTEVLKKCLEIIPDDGDDVTIKATPLSSKSPTILDYKIYKEGRKSYFQIIRADDHVKDNVWRNQQGLAKVLNWKLFDSCGVYYVTMQNILYYLLVKKMYPLTKNTLHQMWNDVRLQVDYECEMAYDLLRLVRRQLMEGYASMKCLEASS